MLYDIVAVLAAGPQAEALANNAAAKDFVSDAYAHAKFVGYVEGATELIGAAVWCPTTGSSASTRRTVSHSSSALRPISACRAREALVHQI